MFVTELWMSFVCGVIQYKESTSTSDKLTWKCYFSDLPFLSFWYTFAARHAFGNFTSVDNFVNDCRENTLPTISIVDPAFTLTDDHPSYDVRMGQKFIGLIVDALTHSESWNNTALVILYDENGGFYDHVVPPSSFEAQAGVAPEDDPLGFRVPALVISPYAKKGICSTVFDHTSILKSIAERWQIDFPEEVFGTRWKLAPSIWDTCFNFAQAPRPMGTYTQSQEDLAAGKPNPLASVSWTTGLYEQVTGPVGGVAEFLERIFILPGLKALDQRAQVLDNLAKMEQNVTTIKQK